MTTRMPIWINVLQIAILAILSYQTYGSYFDPELLFSGLESSPVTDGIVNTLAGRNATMLIISLIALIWQNPKFYAFAFLMHFIRDLQDMFMTLSAGMPIFVFFVFLIVFVIPEALALWTLHNLSKKIRVRGEN